MKIKPEEISQVIKSEIESFEKAVKVEEVGTVIAVGDGIAKVYGVEKAMYGELLDRVAVVDPVARDLRHAWRC